MSKILVLAETGFGKTISASGCQEALQDGTQINIKGLPRASTFFISATTKPLPFRGSLKAYPHLSLIGVAASAVTIEMLKNYRRVLASDGYVIAKVIDLLSTNANPFTDIVVDDTNYTMQDYMMEKSLATGWDAPKKVGHFMSKIFAAIEKAETSGRNVWMLAHYDSKKKNNKGELAFKMKTTGNTTEDMITPEGKMDITLYGIIEKNDLTKKVERYYLTNSDGTFNAKSAPGMLPILIPNDLGLVLDCIRAYYNGDPMPQFEIPQSILDKMELRLNANPTSSVSASEESKGFGSEEKSEETTTDAAETAAPISPTT